LENITDESKQRTLRKTYVEKATEYNDLMNHVTFVQNRYRHVSSLANGSLEKELQEKHRRNMEKLQRIKRIETELKQDFRHERSRAITTQSIELFRPIDEQMNHVPSNFNVRQLALANVDKARVRKKIELHMQSVKVLNEEMSNQFDSSTKEDLKQLILQTQAKMEILRIQEHRLETIIADISPTTTLGHVMSRLQAIVQFQLDSLASNVTKLESKTTEIEKMRNGFNGGWKLALGCESQQEVSDRVQTNAHISEPIPECESQQEVSERVQTNAHISEPIPEWQQQINNFRERGIQSELILTAELDADKEKIIQLETIVKKLKAMNATEWNLELNNELARKEEELSYIQKISKVLEQQIAILNETYRNLQYDRTLRSIEEKIRRAEAEENRLLLEYGDIKAKLEKISNFEVDKEKEEIARVLKSMRYHMHELYAPEHYVYEYWTPKPVYESRTPKPESICMIQ
ncbi:hypothetical protein DPMN_045878, partial [Dreissena polymorpha]